MNISQLSYSAILIPLFIAAVIMALVFTMLASRIGGKGSRKYSFRSMMYVRKEYEKARRIHKAPYSLIYIKMKAEKLSGSVSAADYKPFLSYLVIDTFDSAGNAICRYNDKDYLVISHDSEKAIADKAEQLRSALMQYSETNSVDAVYSVYVGAYVSPVTDIAFEEAVARGVLAGNSAELNNLSYAAWDFKLQSNYETSLEVSRSLAKGLGKNRFYIEIQPIVDVETGNVISGEVLTRLYSESDKQVKPDVFIPLLAHNKLKNSFDFYVLEKACKWLSSNSQMLDKLNYISVNFTRDNLSMPDFIKNFLDMTDKYHVPSKKIAIEILEDKPLHFDNKVFNSNLKELHRLGNKILLDDFGEGSTSITDIQYDSVSHIKISRSILENLNTSNGIRVFESILKIADDLHFTVICEGVETEEQMSILKKYGCHAVQGFYYYHSLPSEQFEKLVAKNKEK